MVGNIYACNMGLVKLGYVNESMIEGRGRDADVAKQACSRSNLVKK